MGINVNINFSSDEKPEVEVSIDAYLIEQIAKEVDKIDRAFGPDRDIGPVRLILREDETLILIGTQKQGDQEYYLDEYDNFTAGYPPTKE